MDYSLQGNRKADEGSSHPDRDAQFQYINEQVRKALAGKRPVISVDTKKKEILGNYQNKGQQWRQAKSPQRVNVHDFPAPSVPRAYPYGVYDLGRNTGFVTIGIDRPRLVILHRRSSPISSGERCVGVAHAWPNNRSSAFLHSTTTALRLAASRSTSAAPPRHR
jgi:hypothetical protein